MSGVTQDQLDSILRRVLEVPDEAREAFLDETCGQHSQLREIVDAMLEASDAADSPIIPGGALSGPLWNELVRKGLSAGLDTGDCAGAWRIIDPLGHGGMATVYLAERADGQFEKTVALKVLHPSRHADELARRFAQERQILASLNHPHIAHLVDGGMLPSGRPYVALEHVDGLPIDRYCDREGLDVDARLRLFVQVAGAIGYAHRNLVIHRDIKPSNILVTDDGVPKLLDFGIAKLLDDSLPHAAPETRSALHPMTPEYASPEQVRGEPLTTASDIYQLGYLLYRLLTGASPYRVERGNYAAAIEAICRQEPVPPSQAARPGSDGPAGRGAAAVHGDSRYKGDVDAIVLKALRKEPEGRYPTAEALVEDLERYRAGLPVLARQGRAGYRLRKFAWRNRWSVAAGLGFLLLATVFGIAQALQTARNAAALAVERDAARLAAAQAETIASFLASLLDSAKPDRTRGEELTVLELLDAGAARVETELAGQPDVQARMLGVISDSYFELGAYGKARELSRKELEIETETWGAEDPRIARTLRRLGEHQYFDGDLETARGTLERALSLFPEGPEGDAGRGRTLGSLGIVLRALGELDAARAAHEQALPLIAKLGDREYERQAWTNYGNLLLVTSGYDDAARAYRNALELNDDPESTRAAGLMANLGMATAAARRPEDALPWFERATAIFEQRLPPEHPSLAKLYSATAECLLMLRRYEESWTSQQQALQIYETALGKDHYETSFALIELGDVLLYTARPAKAENYYRRALDVLSASAGADTVNASYAMRKLGIARLRQGDLSGAEAWLRRAMPIQREALGSDNPRTNATRAVLGSVLVRRGRMDEARSVLEEAMEVAREAFAAEAADPAAMAAAEGAWGEYLLAAGNLPEARPLLLSSYEEAGKHADRASILVALDRLHRLYGRLHEPEQAARYASLAAELRESMQALRVGAPASP